MKREIGGFSVGCGVYLYRMERSLKTGRWQVLGMYGYSCKEVRQELVTIAAGSIVEEIHCSANSRMARTWIVVSCIEVLK